MDDLPTGIADIITYLARMAKGYGNHLKWNEHAKFKADLMNVPQRWRGVDPLAFQALCRAEGMRDEDAAMLVDWLRKAQAGRRLVPTSSYRTFKFAPPPEPSDADLGIPVKDWW